ncbi:methyltransferase domain-containing protein [Alphaproteobacteria bacterium]|nr:methyltransferase domain-containing protein [Alphaproteobacteria bacterium]
MEKITKYWENFYKKNHDVPQTPSDFAVFTHRKIHDLTRGANTNKLLDLGCGNGRDSFYFARNGFEVTAIDQNIDISSHGVVFIKGDLTNILFPTADFIYCRFVVHALAEEGLDKVLSSLSDSMSNQLLFIETRGCEGITDKPKLETFFESGIGAAHFRMLYSFEYLSKKLSKYFDIVESFSDRGFAIFDGEDPVCHRYILKRLP